MTQKNLKKNKDFGALPKEVSKSRVQSHSSPSLSSVAKSLYWSDPVGNQRTMEPYGTFHIGSRSTEQDGKR